MNSHQRRKAHRRIKGSHPHRFIQDWADLAEVPDSATHRLEIKVEDGKGWVHRKDGKELLGRYLSTHTFYGSNHKFSTWLLRKRGFNVTLANWDAPDSPP